MKKLFLKMLPVCCLLLVTAAKAQLYVSPGSSFHIPAGKFIITDSLVLEPDNALTLSDVYIHATDTAVEGPDGPSIKRVYRFSNPVPFTGMVGFYFNDDELNGNDKNTMRVYYNGEDTATFLKEVSSIMPGAQDFIGTTFTIGLEGVTAPVPLNIITAADEDKRLPVKGIYFTNITATSMRVHFPKGNGIGRIVLMRELTTAIGIPTDGIAYTASNEYGSGDLIGSSYIVYTGADDTVTVTNLQPNRRYHVSVFEYATGSDYAPLAEVRRGNATTFLGYATLRYQGQEHLQNLDSLRNGWMPAGWFMDMIYTANDNAASTGPGVYSYGNPASTDRSIGSTDNTARYGVCYRNSTTKPLTSVLLQYTGEQWRIGGSSAPGSEDVVTVEYSTNATSLNTGTWLPATNLDLKSIQTGAGTVLDGNQPANQVRMSGSVSGFVLPHGGHIWFRFSNVDIPGDDDVLAIDDVVAIPFQNTRTGSSTITVASLLDLNVIGANVTVLDNLHVRNALNLEPGSKLSFANRILRLSGKTYGTGELSANASSQLIVGGESLNQNIRFAASDNIIKRLIIVPGAIATLTAPLRITPKGTVTIGSVSENEAATLNSNGNLVFTSNHTGSASLAKSKGTINGKVVSERYLYADAGPNNTLNWRWLANPFTSAITPQDLQDDLPTMDFAPGTGNVYKYEHSTATTAVITNLNGDATQVTTATEEWPMGKTMRFEKPAAATTIDAAGNTAIGTVNVNLTKGANTEFVMAGNPMLSAMRIRAVMDGAIDDGDIDNVLYVWDPRVGTSGAFVTLPPSKLSGFRLQPWGSYVVRMNNPTAQLVFKEAFKLVASPALNAFRGEEEYEEPEEAEEAEVVPPDFVQLQLYKGARLYDEVYEMFSPASAGKYEKDDILKLANPEVNLYATSEDLIRLAGDARPFHAGKTIPLGLKSSLEGRFTFRTGDYTLPAENELYLVDKHTGKETLLSSNASYTCELTKNDETGRFYLRMGKGTSVAGATGIDVQLLPNPATELVNIRVNTQNGEAASVRILAASGALIETHAINSTAYGQLTLPVSHLAAGVYSVEVTTANGSRVTKQLIKQ